jgi:hypothetical protein
MASAAGIGLDNFFLKEECSLFIRLLKKISLIIDRHFLQSFPSLYQFLNLFLLRYRASLGQHTHQE